MVSKIFIIGIGPGNPEYITKKAYDAIQNSDLIFGAQRVLSNILSTFPSKKFVNEYRPEKIYEMLEGDAEILKDKSSNGTYIAKSIDVSIISILFSGSINLYSGASSAIKFFTEKGVAIEEIDGLSSVSYFLSKLHIPENEVNIVSIHGRECDVLSQLRSHKYTVVLLSNDKQLIEISHSINPDGKLNKIKIFVGENLSLSDERITTGNVRSFVLFKPIKNALTIALFQNDDFENFEGFFIKDSEFLRTSSDASEKKIIPMTKENVRTLALEKLTLCRDSVLWDIGAGTGSVSIAAGLRLTSGKVYAFEKNKNAVNLLRKNIEKFNLSNVSIIEGEAPLIFSGFESISTETSFSNGKENEKNNSENKVIIKTPTHAFIGGAGKNLSDIVSRLIEINPEIRIVITAVTLETISECEDLTCAFSDYDISFSEISVTDYDKAGNYHIRKAQNPVMVVSMVKKSV